MSDGGRSRGVEGGEERRGEERRGGRVSKTYMRHDRRRVN
jgi:hypothetical protein